MKIRAYRTTMPFDNRGPYGSPVLSPPTSKSVMPFNNVPTIQDILNGNKKIDDIYPHTRGNWAPGEDTYKSYKDTGDDYKREVRDMDIINKMMGNINPSQKWKLKVPGGSKIFTSFETALKELRENKIPFRYLSRIAQNTQNDLENNRFKTISKALGSCLKVESINLEKGVQETGAAFCIKKNYFITCAHVVKEYNKQQINDIVNFQSTSVNLMHNGALRRATVIAVKPEWDIALLQCDIDVEPLTIETNIKVGEEIIAIGSPHGFENNVSTGSVGSLNREIFSYSGAPEYMFIDASIFPGNSGGPVIKENDASVIGMVTLIVSAAGGYGLNACLASPYIVEFCRDNLEEF